VYHQTAPPANQGQRLMQDPAPSPAFSLTDTRFGRMFTLRGDTVVGRSLHAYGEFAGDEVDSILSLVRPGDQVVDAGANIGFHSLALASAVGPEGSVTAIEPQRYCFQLLCANLTLNQVTTVLPVRAAVGDTPGLCRIPRLNPLAPHNAGATQVLDPGQETAGSDEVPMITLDGLRLGRCDFIKVDTEGFEDRVISGGRRTLEACHPALYVEVHDRDKLKALVHLLRPLNYELTLHHTRFFRTGNPKGRQDQIFAATAGGSALIALPPGRTLPEGLPGTLQPVA
jgi:FkbM family methyltransferase